MKKNKTKVDACQLKCYNKPCSPAYSLREIKDKIKSLRYAIRKNAKDSAKECFGWGDFEICDAIMKLKDENFYKSELSTALAGTNTFLDFYKWKVGGFEIYTHFYIDEDNRLVINSFKRKQKEEK